MDVQKFTIREYQPSNRKQILELMQEFSNFYIPLNPYNRVPHKPGVATYFTNRMIRKAKNKHGKVYVAVNKDRVIGLISFYLRKQPKQDTFEVIDMKLGYIYMLFVQEQFRGHHAGKMLIEKAEEYFKQQGCTHSELGVFGHNIRAHEFYIENGYTNRDINMIKAL